MVICFWEVGWIQLQSSIEGFWTFKEFRYSFPCLFGCSLKRGFGFRRSWSWRCWVDRSLQTLQRSRYQNHRSCYFVGFIDFISFGVIVGVICFGFFFIRRILQIHLSHQILQNYEASCFVAFIHLIEGHFIGWVCLTWLFR